MVDRPLSAPNCFVSSLPATVDRSCCPINHSRCLARVGVSEIGRKSPSMVFVGFDFGTGTTFDCFQATGTTPSDIDAWKIAVTGLLMYGARS